MAQNLTSSEQSLQVRLGSDLQFPIDGTFVDISGLNLLLQDIQLLLLTVPGERVNRPTFGCTLRNQIWENIEQAEKRGASSIKTSLQLYEPRISVTSVTSTSNPNTGLITFSINFTVIQTDTSVNLVFPFRTGTALSFA